MHAVISSELGSSHRVSTITIRLKESDHTESWVCARLACQSVPILVPTPKTRSHSWHYFVRFPKDCKRIACCEYVMSCISLIWLIGAPIHFHRRIGDWRQTQKQIPQCDCGLASLVQTHGKPGSRTLCVITLVIGVNYTQSFVDWLPAQPTWQAAIGGAGSPDAARCARSPHAWCRTLCLAHALSAQNPRLESAPVPSGCRAADRTRPALPSTVPPTSHQLPGIPHVHIMDACSVRLQ